MEARAHLYAAVSEAFRWRCRIEDRRFYLRSPARRTLGESMADHQDLVGLLNARHIFILYAIAAVPKRFWRCPASPAGFTASDLVRQVHSMSGQPNLNMERGAPLTLRG